MQIHVHETKIRTLNKNIRCADKYGDEGRGRFATGGGGGHPWPGVGVVFMMLVCIVVQLVCV